MDQFLGLSPSGQKNIYDRGRKTLDQLDYIIKQDKLKAQRVLFADAAGSSQKHASSPKTTTQKKNNKGQVVLPDSPDCGLSPTNPGRDGTRGSRRLYGFSPKRKVETAD